MALKTQLDSDIKSALLGGDRFRADVLRGLKAAILNQEVAEKKRDDGLTDEAIERLVASEVKKRSESAAQYDQAGRPELADSERKEIEILSGYLPEQLSEAEISTAVQATIDEMGVHDMSGMGQVIGAVKAKLGNAADGALIAKIVKEKLS